MDRYVLQQVLSGGDHLAFIPPLSEISLTRLPPDQTDERPFRRDQEDIDHIMTTICIKETKHYRQHRIVDGGLSEEEKKIIKHQLSISKAVVEFRQCLVDLESIGPVSRFGLTTAHPER
ncbi:hypothetical protein TNCV_1339121 [Trichonephila clavipes]|uniref:Uncharacterized protein n=1 Tax=Trichonephila clavipes TaxID=2585209 RepID=A0A8X6R6B3_TRICX|nr:hypothetical protein TNCV_1339121 [Trichonephila clavipes]